MSVREVFMATAASEMDDRKRREAKQRRGRDAKRKRGSNMFVLFGIFPLLAIPVIIYNIVAMGKGGGEAVVAEAGAATAVVAPAAVSPMIEVLDKVMLNIPMIGGVNWEITSGDMLILLAIGFLFMELLKSTSTGTATIMNHAVSMLLFIVCLIEFLLFPNFATSVFFVITVMTLLDVLAGVVVTIVSARRDFAVGGG